MWLEPYTPSRTPTFGLLACLGVVESSNTFKFLAGDENEATKISSSFFVGFEKPASDEIGRGEAEVTYDHISYAN
jgi:hypothetical protein